jgi:hypothetical protein
MSASKASSAAASNGAKTRTYDIVANSIINLRAGQGNQAEVAANEPAPA